MYPAILAPALAGLATSAPPDSRSPPEVRAATPREKIPTIATAALTVVMATSPSEAQSMFIVRCLPGVESCGRGRCSGSYRHLRLFGVDGDVGGVVDVLAVHR